MTDSVRRSEVLDRIQTLDLRECQETLAWLVGYVGWATLDEAMDASTLYQWIQPSEVSEWT